MGMLSRVKWLVEGFLSSGSGNVESSVNWNGLAVKEKQISLLL